MGQPAMAVSVKTTDGKAWTATVVLESSACKEEHDAARHLRLMLTGHTPGIVGASYFSLCAMPRDEVPDIVRTAMANVHAQHVSKYTPTAAVPMCRVASHQSKWS